MPTLSPSELKWTVSLNVPQFLTFFKFQKCAQGFYYAV